MKLVLGNDQRLYMDALAAALSRQGVTVAALARGPDEILAAVARHKPDICLLSVRCSLRGDVDTLRAISTSHPALGVVILSDGSDSSILAAAADIGAAAVVSPGQHVMDLIAILQRVRAGERPLRVGPDPLGPASSVAAAGPDTGCRVDHLTAREQEVLTLMIEGRANKEIARSLAITVHTVRTHAQSVLVKLGAHSRLEASGMVAQRGLPAQAYGYARPTGARR